ncbi:MAG: PKD domain-containing protein, partial [Bacteroidales bacterium]|nr:PKD domain-containing protein [Bacteroidales bacterium]
GSFNHNNNLDNGTFATEMIQGESIYIEYYEPKFKRGESYFHIASVDYFYKELAGLSKYKDVTTRDVGDSDVCHVNINCSPVGDDWQDEKKGVAAITFLDSGGWYLCSGTLVNNTSYDETPYFLTAFHCGAADASTTELNQWKFNFRYEAVGCTNPSSEPTNYIITGCTKKAVGDISGGSDFFLVQLNSSPTAIHQPYYNGWDRNDTPTSTGVGIHHPAGDIKKISTCSPITKSGSNNISGSVMAANSSYSVKWVANANGHGVTAGGSSGSPLFNANGLQIGTLTGGSSSCTSQTSSDIYGRFSYHWQSNGGTSASQLKPWLDPTNSGATTLPGYDPFATTPPEIHFYADRNYILEGDAINFTDASLSPSGPILSRAWTFSGGTPGTSLNQNPTNIIYNTAGSYDVSLSATNANGVLSETATDMITVIDPTITSCNTYSQWCCNATIYSTAEGYVGGSNEYDCQEIAEYFSGIYPYNTISGFRIYFADVVNATNPDVTFKIYSDNSGQPDMLLSSINIPLSTIETAYTTDGYYDVVFPESTPFPDNAFFVGFTIPQSLSSGDIIAVATNSDSDSDANTGYSLYDGAWETYSSWGMSLQNMIFPELCFEPNLQPMANFSANPRTINAGASVSFTDLSYGGTPASWSWTFDGGSQATSNIQNPIITYSTPGIYSVSLNVSNLNGNTSKTINNYITVIDPNSCSCSQMGNVVGSEVLYTVATGEYLAGYNQYGDLAKAEYFDDGITGNLEGAYFSFGAATVTNTGTNVTFNVYDDSGTGSAGGTVTYSPGNLIGTTTVPITTIANNVANGESTYVAFNPPAQITGNFFIGFDIPSPTNSNDAIGLTTGGQDAGTDKGWEKGSGGAWNLYSEGWGNTFNNAIYPVICTEGAPLPEFTADNTNIVTGTTVNFTDMSTCGPNAWTWTFDGGVPATSTAQNPSVVYNTPGVYTVSLVASNAFGANPIAKTGYVTVSQAPDNIVLWDFPNVTDDNIADGGIAVNLTKTITAFGGVSDIKYTAPGVTTRSVGAETWATGSGIKGWQVIFATTGYGTLKMNFAQMSDNTRSPRDFKVQYSTNGTVWTDLVASYQLTEDVWKQQNNIALPVACENQANVYLRWIMTSNIGTDGLSAVSSQQTTRRNYMDNILVTGLPLNASPVANFSASVTSICAGQSITFTDASTGAPTSWAWSFAGGTPAISTVQNPVITYNTAGTYQVVLTATNTSGFDTETKPAYITVNPSMPVSVSISANQNNICAGTNVTFTATPTNGGTPTYQWKVNGTTVGTGATYSSSSLNNGDNVTCVMTSNVTCASGNPATSNAVSMVVNPILPVSVSISANQNNICAG